MAIVRSRVIVDKDADLTDKMDGNFGSETIKTSISDAIKSVEVDGHATIKITSNLYEEKVLIT